MNKDKFTIRLVRFLLIFMFMPRNMQLDFIECLLNDKLD